MNDLDVLRYPIGRFTPAASNLPGVRAAQIETLRLLPERLRAAVNGLNDSQLDTAYREGGWTVRQVVHHVADSHMTAFHRIRRALTEDMPTVPGYDEKAFAALPDVVAPAEWSLELIEAVHARWVMLLQALTDEQWKRGYNHSERGKTTVEEAAMLYAWHSLHHVAHITHLRKKNGWK